MSTLIEFHCNTASEGQLRDHLLCCDSDFLPPLSDRVDIDNYAHKIFVSSIRFEAWSTHELVGLLAIYCNNIIEQTAYITNISVLKECRRFGIASSLIDQCIGYVKFIGYKHIELETECRNEFTINFYLKNKFLVKKMSDQSARMHMIL